MTPDSAYIEPNGMVSVLRRDGGEVDAPPQPVFWWPSMRRSALAPSTRRSSARRKSEQPHLRELDAGVQPRPVAAEQHLPRPPVRRLGQQVEPAHRRGVRVDVGVAHEHPDHRDLRAPFVGEAAEVRDDELDVGILARHELDGLDLAHRVVEHGHAEPSCRLADLAA